MSTVRSGSGAAPAAKATFAASAVAQKNAAPARRRKETKTVKLLGRTRVGTGRHSTQRPSSGKPLVRSVRPDHVSADEEIEAYVAVESCAAARPSAALAARSRRR